MRLRPVQSAMLYSAEKHRGGFFAARTGSGKLLTSLLIPTAINAKKAVLIVPASRKVPTMEAIRELNKHWRLVPCVVITYNELSQAKNHDLFDRLEPDAIIADEAHSLKQADGPRWRRVARVPRHVPFFAMSGSFANRDLLEWRHLCARALGNAAPVPLDYATGVEWSRALNPRHMAPLEPGPLLTLGPGDDLSEIFGRRVVSAPGVVSSGHDIPDIPLTLSTHELPASEAQKDAEAYMVGNWMTPCEWPIDTAMDMWRHLRELSHGLYYRWQDPPPAEWLMARKEWSIFVREHTSGNWRFDLPTQVKGAVLSGDLPDPAGALAMWTEREPSYTPVLKPVWLDDSTLEYAAAWAAQDREQGIVWVSCADFGERLQQMTGLPYFRQGAEDVNGKHIEQHRGVCIASVSSCSTGHNLQHHQRNLVLSVPSPIILEQLISRTHRDGQKLPVTVEFLLRLKSDHDALAKARVDATTISKQFHTTQRLLYGEWL